MSRFRGEAGEERGLHAPFEVRRTAADNVLPMINIVFLLLVFFLLAGTIAPPRQDDIVPPTTSDQPPDRFPPDAVHVSARGEIRAGGRIHDLAEAAEALAALPGDREGPLRIVADRDLGARALVALVEAAGAAGFTEVRLTTLRGGGT